MSISRVRVLVTALIALAGTALVVAAQAATANAQTACNNYSCADYLQHDLDNYTRARGRQVSESTSPEYHKDFVGACADSSTGAIGNQVATPTRAASTPASARARAGGASATHLPITTWVTRACTSSRAREQSCRDTSGAPRLPARGPAS